MQKIKILLVEDNPGDAALMEEMLLEDNRFCFEMKNAETLNQAVDMLQTDNFDVILLDLGLPDSQGQEALKVMVSKTSGVPILVISGIEDDAKKAEVLKLGAWNYIPKGLMNGQIIADSIASVVGQNRHS